MQYNNEDSCLGIPAVMTVLAALHAESITGIATASSQIAAGNLDLSSRTEQQAASLEEPYRRWKS